MSLDYDQIPDHILDEYGADAYLGEDHDELGARRRFGRRRYRAQYPRNVGRFQRGGYNREQSQRNAMMARQAAVQAQQAALAAAQGPGARGVVLVKDHVEIIVATSATAGAVSKTKMITDNFHLSHATFDGSTGTATVTSLMLHKATVLGPFSSDEAMPVSAFLASSQQKLSLKGNTIRSGQTVTLAGTIAAANDILKLLLFGKREVGAGDC